ncbi:MAG: lysophospholipase [Alphaproteobacteria bacterium]
MRKTCGAFLLMGALAACTPVEQPYVAQASQPPRLESEVFVADDGALLPYRSWLPAGKPRAVLLALHGFNDYSRAFEGTGAYLAAHGIAVYAYDQRGFGAGRLPGIWGGRKNLAEDVAEWIEVLRLKYHDRRLYLLGESMGGAVAIHAATQPGFPRVDGLVLVSPAMWGGDTMNPFYRILTNVSAYMFPGHTVTGDDLDILATDNMEILREMGRDPLIIKATRLDAIYGLVDLMDEAYKDASGVEIPTLLMYGGNDQVILPEVIEKSAEHIPAPLHCIYYPNAYHMLLRDLAGRNAQKDLKNWLISAPAAPRLKPCKN